MGEREKNMAYLTILSILFFQEIFDHFFESYTVGVGGWDPLLGKSPKKSFFGPLPLYFTGCVCELILS